MTERAVEFDGNFKAKVHGETALNPLQTHKIAQPALGFRAAAPGD